MKTIYATILGLTLASGSAFAAVNTNTIADDDDAILNLGQNITEKVCPMHAETHAAAQQLIIDDDASIAKTGSAGKHVAHSADVEAGLFLENDLSL